MRKIRVYIAGPIRRGGLLHNIRQADDAFYRLMKAGVFAPMFPHWNCYAGAAQRTEVTKDGVVCFGSKEGHYSDIPGDDFVETNLAWVRASEAVLRLPGESAGADREVACAKGCGIPVFYTADLLIKWGERALK